VDEATRTSGPAVETGQTDARSPEEIRASIEQTRQELGDTVEELAAKTDVKAHAKAKVEQVKQSRAPMIVGGVLVTLIVVGVVLKRR
jgi:exopolyphosphatase/pppGpp-phosphohydrolase